MANRYWVGGAGTWNSTNTVNWSNTSGGAGGFSVPTSADDVFFDANSGTGTVSFAGATIKSLDCTGYTGGLSSGGVAITIGGSLTWGAGMALNFSGTVTITGTGTITSNGKTRSGATTINGTGITVTLGDALTCGALNVNAGTFDTAGYTVSAASLNSSPSGTRTIFLRSSAISLSGTGTITNISGVATLTFDAGTSTITCTANGAKSIGNTAAAGNSITYYNVVSTGAGALTLLNTNVFNSVTASNTSGPSIYTVQTDSNQTIGTLNLNGNTPTQRVRFSSNVVQTQRTITLTSFGTSTNCDFSDIAVTGAAAGTLVPGAGNIGGNSGIGFPASKTVYWNGSGTQGYAATGWAATSGGAVSSANFPLAQDTAVVNNSSGGTGWTSYGAVFTLGTLDMSSRTTAFNINFGNGSVQFTGSVLFGTGNTFTTTSNSIIFVGSGSSTLQSNGRSINHSVSVNCWPGGSVTLADALSLNNASTSLFVNSGTFNSAGYAMTIGTLNANNAATRAITLGTSAVTILGVGANALNLNQAGMSFSGASSTITFTGTTAITLAGNGNTFGTVTIAGGAATGNFIITGSNTFGTLSSTRTVSYALALTAGTTQTFTTFAVSGSAGNLVNLQSTTTSQATIARPSAWTVGANSVDGGNNTGLSFTGSNPNYLSISYIRGIDTTTSANTNFLSMF